ncbi:MAG: ribbon-helix-helix domain-containing protein [Methanoregula sp.]|nr:ribbon-helix-helix domain-containing protein [Methanoregula sp.]
MDAQKKGKDTIPVRLSQGTVTKIDRLVDTGEYSSRSDFIQKCIEFYLNREEFKKYQMEALVELIRGSPEVREELRQNLAAMLADKLRE